MHFEEKGVNILKKSGEKAKKWIIENSVMADEDNRNLDCGFSRGDKWFRFRVGAIIIEEEKILFVRNRREEFYYTVGGGVHLGETSEEAIETEVYEETGLKYEVDRIAFIHEYFFNLRVDDIRRECLILLFDETHGKVHGNNQGESYFGSERRVSLAGIKRTGKV